MRGKVKVLSLFWYFISDIGCVVYLSLPYHRSQKYLNIIVRKHKGLVTVGFI